MKSKTFSVWNNLFDAFLKEISTRDVSLDDLNTWVDTAGPLLFQQAQQVFFEKHKAEYLLDEDDYNFNLKFSRDQIAAGFDAVFAELLKKFEARFFADNIHEKFVSFKNKCLDKNFHAFITVRSIMTAQMLKANEPDKLKNIKAVVETFQCIETHAGLFHDSMQKKLAQLGENNDSIASDIFSGAFILSHKESLGNALSIFIEIHGLFISQMLKTNEADQTKQFMFILNAYQTIGEQAKFSKETTQDFMNKMKMQTGFNRPSSPTLYAQSSALSAEQHKLEVPKNFTSSFK